MTYGRSVLAGLALAVVASPAPAEFIGPMLEISAESELGSGSFIVEFNPSMYDPISETYDWTLSDDIEILDEKSGDLIAVVRGRSGFTGFSSTGGPQVNLGFSVTSGGAPTLFTITSALLSFPTIANAQATASVGLLTTDLNGDGATLTGNHAGGGAYLAQYNGMVPGGTTFAELLTSVSTAIPFDTAAASASTGAFAPIGGPLDDMSTQFTFLLSASDSAAGTSTFVVVPGPATLVVLAVGLLATGRRRRR